MTNMTFAKGVGTPTYMAPEVFNEAKYKQAAHHFSFEMTLFLCFASGDAYWTCGWCSLGRSHPLYRAGNGLNDITRRVVGLSQAVVPTLPPTQF